MFLPEVWVTACLGSRAVLVPDTAHQQSSPAKRRRSSGGWSVVPAVCAAADIATMCPF